MPKSKKGARGKKASRKTVAADVALTFDGLSSAINSSRGSLNQLQKWTLGSMMDPSLPGTSMQQLALNTRNKASHWDTNSNLRVRPVIFVSGGFATTPEEADHSDSIQPCKSEATLPTPRNAIQGTTLEAESDKVDCISSDEEILFKGRAALNESRPINPSRNVPEFQLATTVAGDLTPPLKIASSTEVDGLDLLIADSGDEGVSDAAINDYIDNMSSDDLAYMTRQFTANRRDLGDPQNDIVIDASSSDGGSDYEQCADTDDNSADEEIPADEIDGALASPESCGSNEPTRRLRCSPSAMKQTKENASSIEPRVRWQLAADTIDSVPRLLAKDKPFAIDEETPALSDTDTSPCATVNNGRSDKHCRRSKRLPAWQAAINFSKDYQSTRGSYPSAEAVADAFEQLDVTGWGRNPDEFELQLSDSELEATLRRSWQKDRMRKKEKRQVRNELRSKGLLQKHADANDPRIKYPNGMSFDDMKAEFHSFLSGSKNSVMLSPMNAGARKVVHEIAHRFQIASKSTGSGDQRRPTLVRKKSTLRLDEGLFNDVFAKYQRRFFARLDGNKSGTVVYKNTSVRNGGGPGAATVRNGEVVGGSAPEIGIQNKGRTMLEKMGWSTGMALGALDNKGMTQIIEHVVKRSKAGLG